MSQTCCAEGSESRPKEPTLLFAASSWREKRDHIAVGERVFMVFDATIRPTGRVGLLPGAGLKRFTPSGQSDAACPGIMYAHRAVVVQRLLGAGGWAHFDVGVGARGLVVGLDRVYRRVNALRLADELENDQMVACACRVS